MVFWTLAFMIEISSQKATSVKISPEVDGETSGSLSYGSWRINQKKSWDIIIKLLLNSLRRYVRLLRPWNVSPIRGRIKINWHEDTMITEKTSSFNFVTQLITEIWYLIIQEVVSIIISSLKYFMLKGKDSLHQALLI